MSSFPYNKSFLEASRKLIELKKYTLFIRNTFISNARPKLAKKTKWKLSNTLKPNFCYLKIIPFLRPRYWTLIDILRVRLHVTEMKSHPRIKEFLFTREFYPRMKFDLKENLSSSMMKTYNKISHCSQLLKSESW